MPELPEVEEIVGVVRRHALGRRITAVNVVRWNGKYFSSPEITPVFEGLAASIDDVRRYGKYVVFLLSTTSGPLQLHVHNAMSGFFDWVHDPWTFDYVEGARSANDSDVRVRFQLDGGLTLRFHDARLFGSMRLSQALPNGVGPEPLVTANSLRQTCIGLDEFARGILRDRRPIKQLLMDQRFIAGVGNIYANEACHLAAVNPHTPARSIPLDCIGSLLESLRCSLLLSIPKVRYHWLNVYRRSTCGSCGQSVQRTVIASRSTFHCARCQGEVT